MNDFEYMLEAFKGDVDAVKLVLSITEIVGVWDDLIDKDKPVTGDQISNAFYLCLVDLPRNPFYKKHSDALVPVITTGIINYHIANAYEEGDDVEAHVMAHTLRYSIADVLCLIAYLSGGMDWAQRWAPGLRRIGQRDTIGHYLAEISARKTLGLLGKEQINV